jgi:Uma2 family endonuclease
MTKTRITGVFNMQPYVIDYSLPAMQVWKNLPEMFPAEVIDDKLFVSPGPTSYHQGVSKRICNVLTNYVEAEDLGEIWPAPLDVYLEGANKGVVMPDVIFISKDNKSRMKRRGFFGVPELLIEILSPGNRKYDLTTKKDLYERTGVKEVWLVDPETKNSQGYLLENKKYGDPLLLNSEIYSRILKKSIMF